MKPTTSKFALFWLGLLFLHASALLSWNTKIMNNFYSFQFPTNKDLSWGQTNDKHVYDRMNYYGYNAGFGNLIQTAGSQADFESATTISAFWEEYDDMIEISGKILRGENPYEEYRYIYPPRHLRYARMTKKIFVSWDCTRDIP